jgi:hypothetical protein
VNGDRSVLSASARRQEIRDDLKLLHERALDVRRASQEVRAESYEIVARCLEARISRENERER